MDRRHLMLGLLAAGAAAAHRAHADQTPAVLLLRHAETDPGIGDPPGFKPGVCATQRNLSEAGRAQARALGKLAATRGWQPQRVRSSAWCRCLDTARLAFEKPVEAWPALDSSFQRPGTRDQALPLLREALAAASPDRLEAWVTHQTNITSFTGEYLSMGEGLLVVAGEGGQPRVLGRFSV